MNLLINRYYFESNTSSIKKFIEIVNPKYNLMLIGKNNRYDHPKDSVLGILNN